MLRMKTAETSWRVFRFDRTASYDTNPQRWSQRVDASIDAATRGNPASLMLMKSDGRTVGTMTISSAAASAGAHVNMAKAYGSVAKEITGDEHSHLVSRLSTSHIVRIQQIRSDVSLSSVQAGHDPVELARIMSSVVQEGCWVRVDFRAATAREASKWHTWLNFSKTGHRGASVSHNSTRKGAVVATFTAGGPDRSMAESMLAALASAMPGFDTSHRIEKLPSRLSSAVRCVLWTIASALLITQATKLVSLAVDGWAAAGMDPWPERYSELAAMVLIAVGFVALVVNAIRLLLLTPVLSRTEADRVESAVLSGRPMNPPRRHGRVRPPRDAYTKVNRSTDSDGNVRISEQQVPADGGDYPLHRRCFMVSGDVFAALSSPHGSEGSSNAAVAESTTPYALVEAVGQRLGTNGSDVVRLNPADRSMGVIVYGRPGSGKSLFIRGLYGDDCAERANPCGRPGHTGERNTLIAFESKGDGAAEYLKWAQAAGDKAILVDATDTSTPAIDVFAIPGDVFDKSNFAVAMLVYVYGEDSVGPRSRETLDMVLPAAFMLDEQMIRSRLIPVDEQADTTAVDAMGASRSRSRTRANAANTDPTDPETEKILLGPRSAMEYAHILLGGEDVTAAKVLMDVVKAHAQAHPEDNVAVDAWRRLAPLASLTPSAFKTNTEAPRNKVKDMAVTLRDWFTPTRSSGSWDSLLNNHLNVVVNLGSPAGDSDVQMDDYISGKLGSMLVYGLWAAIRRNCSSWQSQRRWVTPYSDELSLLAGHSGEVLCQMKDQGRSYGLRPTWATQQPMQLPTRLRENLMTYETLVSFPQNDNATSRALGEQMDMDQAALKFMPPYHAAVSTTSDGNRQRTVVVQVPNSEADREGFLADR